MNSYIRLDFNYKAEDEDIERRTSKQMVLSLGNSPHMQLEKAFMWMCSMKAKLRLCVWLERERQNDQGEIVKEVRKGEKPFITEPPRAMTKSTIKQVLNDNVAKLSADLDALSEKVAVSG